MNQILPLAPAVEEDPNVLIAEDDGMEVDAEAEPVEEVEPFARCASYLSSILNVMNS